MIAEYVLHLLAVCVRQVIATDPPCQLLCPASDVTAVIDDKVTVLVHNRHQASAQPTMIQTAIALFFLSSHFPLTKLCFVLHLLRVSPFRKRVTRLVTVHPPRMT
ncbi:hypothetical protein MRB53_040058 [Persea americana]|nr:hypothetical protein MRB53_040058 [Persea americana]